MGNVKTKATGIGSIKLISIINGKTHIIILEDVLYIPNTNNSLISLGCLDKKGYKWEGYNGVLDIKTANDQVIATRKRISNRLYSKMKWLSKCNRHLQNHCRSILYARTNSRVGKFGTEDMDMSDIMA